MRALAARIGAYFGSADPRLAVAFTVALVIVGNQPFYPLYVAWIAGGEAGRVACLTWLSTPFFAAIPCVGRRNGLAGKLLLLAAGIGNTAVCAMALGRESWVELFYLPCLVLPLVLFGPAERLPALGGAGLVVAALMAALGGPNAIGSEAAGALVRLHVASVVALLMLIAYSAFRNRNLRGA